MVPGFLLADTNPNAAGIFCLLLLLASHPCRALRSTHTSFPSHTHIQTYTDEHMMNYKYSGQDWRYVQHNVRRGHNTHCAHFNPATELSVSTLMWENKTKKKTCTSAHLMLFIQADLSMNALYGAQTQALPLLFSCRCSHSTHQMCQLLHDKPSFRCCVFVYVCV